MAYKLVFLTQFQLNCLCWPTQENHLYEDLSDMESGSSSCPTNTIHEVKIVLKTADLQKHIIIRLHLFKQLRSLQAKLREKPALVDLGNYGVLDKKLLTQVTILLYK